MIGPWNHSPLTGKPGDVDFGPTPRGNMVYTTSPLQEALEVTGPISAEIRASSSSVDTGLTAKLGDVWPSGYAQNLTDGIVRARYRDSFEKPEFMNPGQIYRFSIDLWATGNVFLPGHRLRLEISSSNFPRFNRNLSIGEDLLRATRMMKATNAIYHDRDHASELILPVIAGSSE